MRTAALLALALAGCGRESPPSPPPPPAADGPALFARRVGGLSCADCHSTTAEDQPRPDRRRVGHTLADATRRPTWWHGELDAAKGATVLDAIRTCVARFQHRTWNTTFTDLSKVEIPTTHGAALVAHLESLARPGPHLPSPARRDDSREALLRVEALTGDAARGREVWSKACALCHGEGGENQLGPSLRGKLAPDRRRVIAYVRGGPGPTDRRTADAWMPFFTPDVLPDQDLADLAELIDGGAW